MTNHIAVVPVKGLTDSKKRLSSDLSEENRTALVKALLEDVLVALVRASVFSKVYVISPDENVGGEARLRAASFVRQSGIGLNAAVEQATKLAMKDHAGSLTAVLADIPLAEPRDFIELFKMGGYESKVVMAPSLKGGTNVMSLSPANAIAPAYGRWSYARHLRLAQKRKLNAYSMSNRRVSFDIDTIHDLTTLRRLDHEGRTASGRLVSEITRLASVAQNARRES